MQHLHFFEPKVRTKNPPLAFFLHSATGHARMFYADTMALLERGFVCASLEAPYAKSRNVIQPRGLSSPVNERCIWDRTSEELMLAIEECGERWSYNPEQLAFIGLNLGGSVGAYWLAKGAPVRAAIITGAIPDLTDFYLSSDHPVASMARAEAKADLAGYEKRMRETDLVETLPRIKNIPVMVQVGAGDSWIGAESRKRMEAAVSLQSNLHLSQVDDDHDMKGPASVKQRVDFLEEAFGLEKKKNY